MLKERSSERLDRIETIDLREPTKRLFDLHPTASLAYDEAFRIVDANAAAVALLGRSKAELIGRDGMDFVHPDDAPNLRAALAWVAADRRRNYPGHFRVSSGSGPDSWTPITNNFQIVDASGPVRYITSMMPAAITVAFDSLVESVLDPAAEHLIVPRLIAACEASGHYPTSWHATAGYSGVGPFGATAGVKWADTAAVREAVRGAVVKSAGPVILSAAGLLETPPIHLGSPILAGVVHPVCVAGAVAAALVAWTVNRPEDGIGSFGGAMLLRNSRVAGLAIEAKMDREAAQSIRRIGDLTIDRTERRVTVSGRVVKLTPMEASIVGLLAERPGRSVSRTQINLALFGSSFVGLSRACDVHIKNLRRKLGAEMIETVYGAGYALRVR